MNVICSGSFANPAFYFQLSWFLDSSWFCCLLNLFHFFPKLDFKLDVLYFLLFNECEMFIVYIYVRRKPDIYQLSSQDSSACFAGANTNPFSHRAIDINKYEEIRYKRRIGSFQNQK